jgi:hypothetical protein
LGRLPLTYVGHSPLRDVTVHNSYVYIDQGTGMRVSRQVAPTTPTVIDHRKFAYWLEGVTTTRTCSAGASKRSLQGTTTLSTSIVST